MNAKKSESALNAELEIIQKEWGATAVMRMSERTDMHFDVVSTGILPLDIALDCKGYPLGRIVEVFGGESVGKTTIALQAVASFQQAGHQVVYMDTEHALDEAYATALGVDVDALIISQPDYGEQALNFITRLAKTGEIGLVVVDSVAALTPKAEIEGDFGDAHVGLQARMMSQAFRKPSPRYRTPRPQAFGSIRFVVKSA